TRRSSVLVDVDVGGRAGEGAAHGLSGAGDLGREVSRPKDNGTTKPPPRGARQGLRRTRFSMPPSSLVGISADPGPPGRGRVARGRSLRGSSRSRLLR